MTCDKLRSARRTTNGAMLALLVLSAVPARAEPPSGLYELKTVVTDGERKGFIEKVLGGKKVNGADLVWARMTFKFGEGALIASVEMLTRDHGVGFACEARLEIEVAWDDEILIIPVSASADGRVVRIDKVSSTKQGSGNGVASTNTKTNSDANSCSAGLTKGRYRVKASGGNLTYQRVGSKQLIELVPADAEPHYDERLYPAP